MRELQTILNVAVNRLGADVDADKTIDLKSFAEVISEDKGDIDTAILKTVATLKKVAVLVSIGAVSSESPNASGPVIDDVVLFVEVSENPVLNRKGVEGIDYLTALDVAQIVASSESGLHHFKDETTGITYLIETSGPFIRPTPPPKGATTAYSIYFKTTGVIAEPA